MNLSSPVIKNPVNRNILFVYHRLDVIGGMETRWIDEFEALNKKDYKVFFLVPSKRYNCDIAKLLPIYKIVKTDISKVDLASNFIELVHEIIHIIENENINVISIHMLDNFSCAAIIAAQICKIPMISTIHGILDIYRMPIQRIFVQHLAAKSFSLSVSVSNTFETITPSIGCKKAVIPNLINLDKYQCNDLDCNSAWLIINRISSEKFPSILRFLQAADYCGITEVDIAGAGDNTNLKKSIEKLSLKVSVKFLGEIEDIPTLITKYAGVAGMGRVALESLACKKPTCIISLDGKLLGLVTPENISNLGKYNFTGKGLVSIKNEDFLAQLDSFSPKKEQEIHSILVKDLSLENWAKYIQQLYTHVEFESNPALEALYHKLSFFSKSLSSPFIKDKFFQSLLYETLVEYDFKEAIVMWKHYENDIGLTRKFPNPFNKKKWWQKIK